MPKTRSKHCATRRWWCYRPELDFEHCMESSLSLKHAYPDERAAFMKGRPSVVAARMGSIHYFDGQTKEWARDAE